MSKWTPEVQSISIFSEIDEEIGRERYDPDQHAERLTRKFVMIMGDEDLNMILGGYVRDLILLGALSHGKISQDQVDRVDKVIRTTLHGMMSPADLAMIERERELVPESRRP